MRVLVLPSYSGTDTQGDGGIRRIVEAQVKYLPKYGIDVVNSAPYDLIALHAGDWPRRDVSSDVPIVSACHGLYWGEYEWDKGTTAVNNRVVHNLLRSTKISVCSEFVARAVRKSLWLDPAIIYHGVDPDEWGDDLYCPHNPYILWNKARVDAVCDPQPVTQLASMLPMTHFISTFAGSTTFHNMHVTGRVSYAQSRMLTKNADVYLATTRGTFEISVIEAMLCGVPVLGWNWGSLPEIVAHKVHGYLAEPGNYDDLVVGYHYIQSHRETMSKACTQRVMHSFTWDKIMSHYAELYLQAMEHDDPATSTAPVFVL